MPEDRASREGLLYLKEDELRSVLRNVPISDVYCVEDTVFARGKFATVRRALHKTTGVQYAAKYIKKRRRNVNMVPEIYHEISVLLKCASNNRVVRLYEVYESNSDIVLILGLAAGGELQRIFDGDQCLGEIEARRAMRQILEGLCFLHERNIAHLDLKPQNILLMVEDSCDDIKLCDFGISRLLEPGTEVRTLSGTPDYVAPEVVSYEPISLATDIWSVGVLAYVLLSGYTPFGADTKEQTSLNISKGIVTFEPEDFVDVSSVALDFIKSILVLNPKQRPTVQELLQHPWMSPQGHILPSLSLKTSSDAINTTPKSTPINPRKSLSCPPETPATNNTRTPFNSDNLNGFGNSKDEEDGSEINVCSNEIEDGPSNKTYKNAENDIESICANENEIEITETKTEFINTHFNQEAESASPNDILSEASSEEIEENFYLLKSSDKFVSTEDLSGATHTEHDETKEEIVAIIDEVIDKITGNFNLYTNSECCENKIVSNEVLSGTTHIEDDESQQAIAAIIDELIDKITDNVNPYTSSEDVSLYKSCEDLLSDSGIVGSIELENDSGENLAKYLENNESDICESTEIHSNEVSEIIINIGLDFNVVETTCDGDENDGRISDETQFETNTDNNENVGEKTFINTCEISKPILLSLNSDTILEDHSIESTMTSDSILINSFEVTETLPGSSTLQPTEVALNINTENESEEIEYSQEENKVFINTYEINNNTSST